MLRPGLIHEKIGEHFVLPHILTIGHFVPKVWSMKNRRAFCAFRYTHYWPFCVYAAPRFDPWKQMASILCFHIYSPLATLCLCCTQGLIHEKIGELFVLRYILTTGHFVPGLIHEKNGEHFVPPDMLTTGHLWFCANAAPRFDPWKNWPAFCASGYTQYWPYLDYVYAAPMFAPWKNGEHFVLPDILIVGHFVPKVWSMKKSACIKFQIRSLLAILCPCCAQVCSMKKWASILCFQMYSLLAILCLSRLVRFDPWKIGKHFVPPDAPRCERKTAKNNDDQWRLATIGN